jgi:membrane-bound metal-dependent hydrolase YbcI (DUF457 family)
MDFISHALIGRIFCFFDKKTKGLNPKINKNWVVIFFAVMPDVVLIPFYAVLGKENNRFLWIAQNQDWVGSGITHPILTNAYNTTHSIFFAFLIILPIILILKIKKSAFFVYLFHIFIDIFTHTGEWSIKFLFPLDFNINGFTNAWAWPIPSMAISWIIFSGIILYLNKVYKKKT